MSLLSEKTLKKWKEERRWLRITENQKMICTVSCSQEDIICSMPNVSMSFLNGSMNFWLPSIKDHDSSACHQRAICEKQHSEAVATGISLPPRWVEQHIPPNSAIATGLQWMDEKVWDTVEKLHEISFNTALKGLPFTALRSQAEIEKFDRVNFTGSYENETACKTFIFGISEYLFEETVKKKLESVKFITVLCDGSTGNSVTEQEVLYVIFADHKVS